MAIMCRALKKNLEVGTGSFFKNIFRNGVLMCIDNNGGCESLTPW